jgi:hypothetical protein
VKALLSAEGRLRSGEEHVDKFVLVERWRKGMPNQINPIQTKHTKTNQVNQKTQLKQTRSTKTNQINPK